MKPITLKVAGLQSYREQQTIDFEGLTETGLFGIFGPTGSGKSSLLDAITLAMYGKVERAAGGTQGIMNHSEDQLGVAFTFELTSAAGPRRFRVERKFKRTGEQSVSNTISRFIEVHADGEEVLADKLADVTRCVEEHIGLKMDDFTRAVVLPQGKFAEFLSLRGADRRQMLQRLFHLEQYGDQLAMKLSRRVKDNDAALQTLEAEQQGLGGAGKADVDTAAGRLEEAVRHAAECRAKLEAAQRLNEQYARIRELQEERQRRERQRQGLLEREPAIRLLEEKLGKADEAEKRLPALAAWRSADEAWRGKLHLAETRERAAAEAAAAAEALAAAETAAAAALAAEEPALRQGADQFRRALELEAELARLQRELAEALARQSEASQGLAARREALARERELLAKGQKRQQELQQSLQPLSVRSQERASLQEALQRLQALRSAESLWGTAERERREREAQLAAAQARLAAAGERQQALAAQGGAAVNAAALHREALRLGAAAAASAAARLAERAAAHEAALKAQERRRLSLTLAGGLLEGQPCPVCGSMDHPAPAVDGAEDSLAALEEGLQAVRALEKRAHEAANLLRGQLEQDQAWLEQAYGDLAGEASGALVAAGLAQEALGWPQEQAAGLLESGQSAETPSLAAVWAAAGISFDGGMALGDAKFTPSGASHAGQDLPDETMLSALETALPRLKARSGEQRRAAGEWQRAMQEAQQHSHKEAAQTAAEQSWADGLAAKADEQRAGLAALRGEWEARFPGMAPGEAEAAYRDMQHKDEQAEEIRGRLDIAVKFLDEKSAAVQSLQEQAAGLDKELTHWNAQLEGKQVLAQEKEERLRQITGGRSAAELLAECEERLRGLQAALESGRERARSAAELSQQETREAAIARQAEVSAREHLASAASRWQESLAASPFSAPEEVEAASLGADERTEAAARVQAYRAEEAEVALQLRDIEAKLGTGSLSETQWQESVQALRAGKEADEQALQSRARAQRDLEDVQQRHVRWLELEERRKEHAVLQDRLAKLQSVLRGNAFVEYIAEEQLMQVCQSASQRLRFLSKQRYALEVDSGGGFVIRDDGNGGVKRPVSTLSGGETFLTSLSLALALSAQIQLRGQYPLQFFFLDEGFGTLDPELLETVITSLERLHNDQLSVGIISHVPELRARLPRKLIVVPAEQGGEGSRIVLEKM
ncbi:AAA family ATPase [Paenibacillus sp. NFR01]|uniref:AAA family ATPase n=1 Tax=Paenibacillus sp. NFR01 TaxID=1566279 RepID=UPI0008C09032|nr:SMC family ATPase [Paenibacillus sp. NFR01]SET65900.1 exonuclease SbcC [Paenibacillus sp. NFR01]